jgi:hypothetical protein
MANPIICRFCQAQIGSESDACAVCGSPPPPPPKPKQSLPAIPHIETAPTVSERAPEAPQDIKLRRIVLVIHFDA